MFGMRNLLLLTVTSSVLLIGCTSETTRAASLSISTELLDFGEVPLDTEETLQITLTNDGGVDFEVLSASLIEGRTAIWS